MKSPTTLTPSIRLLRLTLTVSFFSLLLSTLPTAAWAKRPQRQSASPSPEPAIDRSAVNFFSLNLPVKSIDGQAIPLETYRNQVLLVVNTASRCGYTSQYQDLVALQKKYQEQGLIVLGFPSNDFWGQEPGSNAEIKKFCLLKFQVNFPLFEKAPVSGEHMQPLFDWLTHQSNPDFTGSVKWNFEKFLISRQGLLLRRFRSSISPQDPQIESAVKEAVQPEKP